MKPTLILENNTLRLPPNTTCTVDGNWHFRCDGIEVAFNPNTALTVEADGRVLCGGKQMATLEDVQHADARIRWDAVARIASHTDWAVARAKTELRMEALSWCGAIASIVMLAVAVRRVVWDWRMERWLARQPKAKQAGPYRTAGEP